MTEARKWELAMFVAGKDGLRAVIKEMWESRVSHIKTVGRPEVYVNFKDGSQLKMLRAA